MSFSLAGYVITQSNESGIAITAAASITGGVRFTCTQAYAAGNLIRITGTTNYNGEWIVDAATGTTFDVKLSAKGDALAYVSSQSGTAARGDSSLAAIAAISGVTTRAINQGYTVTHTTYLMNLQLVVTGSLRIRPRREMLEFGTTAPLQELRVNSGGVLTVEERYGATYGTHQWIRITRVRGPGEDHWAAGGAAASMFVASGGTFRWAGGSMAVTSLWNQGTTTIDSGVINGQPFNWSGAFQDSSYFFDNGGTVTINSLVIGRAVYLVSWAGVGRTYTNLSGTPGGYEGEGNPAQGGTLTGVYTLVNLPDGALGFRVLSTRQGRVTIVNSVQGSSAAQLISFNDPATNYPNGRIEFRKRVTFQFLTTALVAIQGVNIFTRDTNNGSRSNRTNDNYVDDRTYLGTSDASGLTSQLDILTAVARPTSSGNATPVYDRRSTANADSDIFRWSSWSYGHLLSDLSIQTKGVGDLTQGVTLFTDAGVTLSQSAAAALTVLTTLNDLYDAGKNWKCQNITARLEYPTVITQPITANGDTLLLGALSLIVDATAAAAFAINTGTNAITVKATALAAGSKFGYIKSTSGTITLANAAAMSCGVDLDGAVLVAQDIDAVTGAITTTGTCRIDVAAPGVYPAAAINAASKIRVTAATSGDIHDCRACVFTSGAVFENNSGQPITVKLTPAQTTPTKLETSGTITFDNLASATLTVSGFVTGSDVVIYDAAIAADGSGSNVLQTSDAVSGTSTTYSYTYGVVSTVDIGVFKNGYRPTFVRGVVLSVSDATIPISQPLDPSYVA